MPDVALCEPLSLRLAVHVLRRRARSGEPTDRLLDSIGGRISEAEKDVERAVRASAAWRKSNDDLADKLAAETERCVKVLHDEQCLNESDTALLEAAMREGR